MTSLLDINVLLAIAWPQHVHHTVARTWLAGQMEAGRLPIATCPITQLGFLRISMNIKGYAADFESACSLLASLIEHRNIDHTFWADDYSILAGDLKRNPGPNQLTDAYLVALAESRLNGRLVTLDAGIKGLRVEQIAA